MPRLGTCELSTQTPYNPLDKQNLGSSVARALLEQAISTLPPESPFAGAGIYAIYYAGDHPAYAHIARANRDGRWAVPVYVGKAIPPGARKGGFGLSTPAGNVLHRRLCEHGASVTQALNLRPEDFACRFLVVDDIWIPLGENLLIERFSPAWNVLVDGFGNHDPGSGRHQQRRSWWDALHPGRSWAEKLRDSDRTQEEITQVVREALARTRES